MIDHVTLGVADFGRSQRFYDAALAPLGIARLYADGQFAAGYGANGKAFFWIAERPGPPARTHVAFRAPDLEAITAFHKAGIDMGGRDNGPPGPRPEYHDRYFAAFVLDPDGNNIEAVIQ